MNIDQTTNSLPPHLDCPSSCPTPLNDLVSTPAPMLHIQASLNLDYLLSPAITRYRQRLRAVNAWAGTQIIKHVWFMRNSFEECFRSIGAALWWEAIHSLCAA
jgi:hypothetical protein